MSSVIMNCGGAASGPVTGMPFSAQEITEKSLLMPNGSINKQTLIAMISRDIEGRTRRELMPAALPGQPAQPGITMISDPVAGFLYLLHPNMIVLRSLIPGAGQMLAVPGAGGMAGAGAGMSLQKPPSPLELGERMIQGFLSKGTRSTMTMPAGFAGNTQPIQMIAESWCAKQLGAIVESSHSNPNVGDVVTRLQGIQQTHPPSNLFQIPPGYQVIDSARSAAPRA
jgi:hypothetical protein